MILCLKASRRRKKGKDLWKGGDEWESRVSEVKVS
jgi:hypothetical protein